MSRETGSTSTVPVEGTATAEDVARRITPVILRIARRIRPSSGDLSAAHFSMLATLRRHGPQRPSDLSRIEHVSPPGVARAIGTLQERGLVRRQPSVSDARSNLVEITEDGVRLLEEARDHQAETVTALLEGLEPDQLDLVSLALGPLEALALALPTPDADGDTGSSRVALGKGSGGPVVRRTQPPCDGTSGETDAAAAT
jgi:DNA-binding MarR family transcriptional regulator